MVSNAFCTKQLAYLCTLSLLLQKVIGCCGLGKSQILRLMCPQNRNPKLLRLDLRDHSKSPGQLTSCLDTLHQDS